MKAKRIYGLLIALLLLLVIPGSAIAQTTQFTTTDEFDSGTKTNTWTQTDDETIDFGTVQPAEESIMGYFPDIVLTDTDSMVETDIPAEYRDADGTKIFPEVLFSFTNNASRASGESLLLNPNPFSDSGDLLYSVMTVRTGGSISSVDCGAYDIITNLTFDNAAGTSQAIYCVRLADETSADTLNLTITTSGPDWWGIIVMYVIGSHGISTLPGDLTGMISGTIGFDQLSPNPPSLTPPGGSDDYLWIASMSTAVNNAQYVSGPSGYANCESHNRDPDGAAAICSKALEAGSEDPGTFTITGGAGTDWYATTTAIPPAAALYVPNNVQEGDYLIAARMRKGSAMSCTTTGDPGWNELFEISWTNAQGTWYFHACQNVADADDVGTLAGVQPYGVVYAIRDHDLNGGSPEYATASLGSGDDPNPPSITPSYSNFLILTLGTTGHDNVAATITFNTPPAGYENSSWGIVGGGGGPTNFLIAASSLNGLSGAQNPGAYSFTCSGCTQPAGWGAATIAIPNGATLPTIEITVPTGVEDGDYLLLLITAKESDIAGCNQGRLHRQFQLCHGDILVGRSDKGYTDDEEENKDDGPNETEIAHYISPPFPLSIFLYVVVGLKVTMWITLGAPIFGSIILGWMLYRKAKKDKTTIGP